MIQNGRRDYRKVLDEKEKYTKEYGPFKFKIFPYEDLQSALALQGEGNLLRKILTLNIEKYYDLLKEPKENEWLMTHKEYGQTFIEFARGACKLSSEKSIVIDIMNVKLIQKREITTDQQEEDIILCQPFESSYLGDIIAILNAYFPSIQFNQVDITISVSEQEYLMNSWEVCSKSNNSKRKINGIFILKKLYKKKPKEDYCQIALLSNDMYYIHNKTNTIENCYELRNSLKRTALISTARFLPLYYLDNIEVKEEENKKKLTSIAFKREMKLIIRNIALMFGLTNCIFFSCILNGFNYMNEFDGNPFELCPVCLRKVFGVLLCKSGNLENSRKGDYMSMYQRFDNLRDTLTNTTHKGIFESEIFWYKNRHEDLSKII